MRAVWKFGPLLGGRNVVAMPDGAQILSVQAQSGEICLWVEVESSAVAKDRFLYVYGTGWDMEKAPWMYLGTVQLEGGALVFHIYEGLV